jgi:hypothetical protein
MPKRKGGVLKSAHGITQGVRGSEPEVEGSNSGVGDSREQMAQLQGGDVLENGRQPPFMPTDS